MSATSEERTGSVIAVDRSGRAAALARRLGLPVIDDTSAADSLEQPIPPGYSDAPDEEPVSAPEEVEPELAEPECVEHWRAEVLPPMGVAADLAHDLAVLQTELSRQQADLRAIQYERDQLAAENHKLAQFFDRVDGARQARRLWISAGLGLLALGGFLINGYVLNPTPPDPVLARLSTAAGGKRIGVIARAGAEMLRGPEEHALQIARLDPGARVVVRDVVTVALEPWVVVEAVGTTGYVRRLEINLAP